MRLPIDRRLRTVLVSSVVLGFGVTGGTLVFCGFSNELQGDFFGRLLMLLIGGVWVVSPIVALLYRKTFIVDEEYSPIAGLAIALFLFGMAILNTPGLMWPWRDYPWMLPSLALAVASMSYVVILDRQTSRDRFEDQNSQRR